MSPFSRAVPATLLLLALLAAGCDSADSRLERYTGVIEVGFSADRSALRLVAVDDLGCNHPLRVSVPIASPERLHVRVEGIDRPTGASCEALIPASAEIPWPWVQQGTYPVLVEHAGSRDEYSYTSGFAGVRFVPVRIATTRPAGG